MQDDSEADEVNINLSNWANTSNYSEILNIINIFKNSSKKVLTFFWIYIILRHVIEAWLSLVERCVRDAEVACSNHVASILL